MPPGEGGNHPICVSGLAHAGFMFSVGTTVANGGVYNAGDTFTITFNSSSANAWPVGLNVVFDTAAVTILAAGLMLLVALGGATALRRRKAAAA